jgi:hypothetical protein
MSALSPGQLRQLRRIEEAAHETAASGRGRVIFLAGDEGSGRSFLVEKAGAIFSGDRRFRVMISAAAEKRRATAGSPRGSTTEQAVDAAGEILSAAATLNPGFDLIRRLLQLSHAAVRTYKALQDRPLGESEEPAALLLRTAALENPAQPLICLIDDAQMMDANWWRALQFALAQQTRDELPLLLVLVVDGPAALEDEPDDLESQAVGVARSLAARGLAEWRWIGPVGHDEAALWLGPAARNLLKALIQASNGLPGVMAQIWQAWQARNLIEQSPSGRWEATKGIGQLLADIADEFSARLGSSLSRHDAATQDLVRLLLGVGALEGRTFTAESAAAALDIDRDQAIDLLDELVVEDEPSRGILLDVGALAIPDLTHRRERTVWRYRFTRDLDWRAAQTQFTTPEERPDLARRLVEALIDTFEPEAQAIAHVLIRLNLLAGDLGAAAHCRSLSLQPGREVLKGQARYLLRANTAGWTMFDFRSACDLLIEACLELGATESAWDLIPFAVKAAEYGREAEVSGRASEATAVMLQGGLLGGLGKFEEARERLLRALEMVETGAPRTKAAVLCELGTLEGEAPGDFKAAVAYIEQAEDIFDQEENHHGLALCMLHRGRIEMRAERLGKARGHTLRCLELAEGIDDKLEIKARLQLGEIDNDAGRNSSAKEQAMIALHYFRARGDLQGEGAALSLLAGAEWNLHNAPAAWEIGTAALEIFEGLTEPQGAMAAQMVRGAAARELGWTYPALTAWSEAQRLAKELGDASKENECRALIANLGRRI